MFSKDFYIVLFELSENLDISRDMVIFRPHNLLRMKNLKSFFLDLPSKASERLLLDRQLPIDVSSNGLGWIVGHHSRYAESLLDDITPRGDKKGILASERPSFASKPRSLQALFWSQFPHF